MYPQLERAGTPRESRPARSAEQPGIAAAARARPERPHPPRSATISVESQSLGDFQMIGLRIVHILINVHDSDANLLLFARAISRVVNLMQASMIRPPLYLGIMRS